MIGWALVEFQVVQSVGMLGELLWTARQFDDVVDVHLTSDTSAAELLDYWLQNLVVMRGAPVSPKGMAMCCCICR